jgi:DNA primase catalytic subunit
MAERMDPVTLSRVLKHYKRIEVQREIVKAAQNKEAVGSFGGKGYGRRPDVLVYPNDVMEQVKNGVTSFHVSEELWSNPQMISTEMKKHEYEALRVGWDLVLDIDCPQWEFAKIVTWLFVKALQEHGIDAVSAKFSGNKGFHIGVPFEAFPEKIYVGKEERETKDLFPDGPRRVAAYLLDYIGRKHVTVINNQVTFGNKFTYSISELQERTGKAEGELMETRCANCGKERKQEAGKQIQFTCPQCNSTIVGDVMDQYRSCYKCKVIMEKSVTDLSKKCCSVPKPVTSFNPLSIVEVDTVLIAPRHLYRAPYSYHEKSGLVSVPIHPDTILDFDKNKADPASVVVGEHDFLLRDSVVRGQAKKLLVESFDFVARKEQKVQELEDIERMEKGSRRMVFEDVQTAIPEKFFPPCIQAISQGMKDGKKRAVFIMTNFLSSCGWDYDDIDEWFRKWNEKNPEPLREQLFLGRVRYAKQQKKKVLPPNCDNSAYYKSFGVCKPDNFCRYVKNPANYAIKRARYAQREAGKGKGRGKKAPEPQKQAKQSDAVSDSESPKSVEN